MITRRGLAGRIRDSHVLGLLRLQSGKVALCYARSTGGSGETDELLEGPAAARADREQIFFRTSVADGLTWSEETGVTPLPGDDLYALYGSTNKPRANSPSNPPVTDRDQRDSHFDGRNRSSPGQEHCYTCCDEPPGQDRLA